MDSRIYNFMQKSETKKRIKEVKKTFYVEKKKICVIRNEMSFA